jgi:hypothetical protein
MKKKMVLVGALGLLSVGLPARATVVWQDTMTRGTDPTTLNPFDFAGGAAGDDWSSFTGATVSVTGGRAIVTDTSTSTYMQATVSANQWAGFSSTPGNQVTYSVDLKITSMGGLGATSVSVPRFVIVQGGAEVLTAGFATQNVDGDAGSDLFFYAVPAAAATTPGASGAIGLSGGVWAGGFDFGEYDGTTAANNDSNGRFYRLALTFTQGSTAVSGTLTNLDTPAESISFDRTLGSAFVLTNAGNSNFRLLTGQGGATNFEFDNVTVDTVVPEPASLGLVGLGAAGLLGRRRRRA